MPKSITLVGPSPDFKILVQLHTADTTDGSFYEIIKGKIQTEIERFIKSSLENVLVTVIQINLSKV